MSGTGAGPSRAGREPWERAHFLAISKTVQLCQSAMGSDDFVSEREPTP